MFNMEELLKLECEDCPAAQRCYDFHREDAGVWGCESEIWAYVWDWLYRTGQL